MKTLLALNLAALAAFSVPAAARDLGHGFSLTGNVQFELYHFDSVTDQVLYGDVTLGWRSQGGGAFGLGFDINPLAFRTQEAGTTFDSYWGGLVLTTDLGELTIGKPRPLFDTLSRAPDIGTSAGNDISLMGLDGRIVSYLDTFFGDLTEVQGISFRGGNDQLSYGIAYHQLTFFSLDATVLEVTAAYRAGATEVYGGVMHQQQSTTDLSASLLTLGAEYTADRWSAGLEILRNSGDGAPSTTSTVIFAEAEVMDRLTLMAQIRSLPDGGTADLLYGIGGRYTFGSGAFAELGMLGDDAGSGKVISASLGIDF